MTPLILYSKPGCHLCEGLQEKLEKLPIQLEIRDITQNEAWFQQYQYEVPVICYAVESATGQPALEKPLPRVSPRASAEQVSRMIQTNLGPFKA